MEARVLFNSPESGLRTRIEAALDGKPVRFARIESNYRIETGRPGADNPQSLDELERLQPDEIFKKLHLQQYSTEPSSDLLEAFRELLLAPDEEANP